MQHGVNGYPSQAQNEEEARIAHAIQLSQLSQEDDAMRMRREAEAEEARRLGVVSQISAQQAAEAESLRQAEEVRMARAMQASVDEENLRKAIEMSLRDSSQRQ